MSASGLSCASAAASGLNGRWCVAKLDGATVGLSAGGWLRAGPGVASLATAFAEESAGGPDPADDQAWMVPAALELQRGDREFALLSSPLLCCCWLVLRSVS